MLRHPHFASIGQNKVGMVSKAFNETKNMKNPKNKILFGPPGTGKTYKLSHEYFSKYTTTESSLTRMGLLENLIREEYKLWR